MTNRNMAIKVEDVSKLYRIGAKEQANENFISAVASFVKAPLRNLRRYRSLYDFSDVERGEDNNEVLWALRGVSFDVAQGEVLGIIGTNGAGKSTLLKILARITPPTKGRIQIHGRVGSLLEVGTGFHQELTGRENIYLNGTILGMRKREVDRKFDQIVDFSGMEKFLDTPVKRYSSGMRVRLAFAVAAHLEPEILIIDEVLAVGDAAFQRKCMNKMQDVGQHGRTVLFVSHNMSAVTRLCERVVLLNEGRILKDGAAHEVVNAYLSAGHGTPTHREWPDPTRAPGDQTVRLRGVRIVDQQGQTLDAADIRKPIGLQMEYEVLQDNHRLMPYFHVFNDEGIRLFTAIDQDEEWRYRTRPRGRFISTAWIPGNLLSEGTLYIGAAMRTIEPLIRHFNARDAVACRVVDTMEGDSVRGDYPGGLGGVIRPSLQWHTQYLAPDTRKTAIL